jgi:aminoglycoside 6'-N-acetyltransferase
MSLPVLRGERVILRPLVPDDRPRLAEILAEPSVDRWWGASGADAILHDIFEDHEATCFGIDVDGVLVGSIQYGEENDRDYRHASIDIFISADYQGQGLGPDALRTLARHLFDDRGHHRITIDPAVANERAIASYRRVGFRPVGVMRNYERAADDTWHDGLLMDLLRGELT